MLGMVLSAGQTVKPGGVICGRARGDAGIDVGDVAVELPRHGEVRPAAAGAEVEVVLAEAFVENTETTRGQPSCRRPKQVVRKAEARRKQVLGRRESARHAGTRIADQSERRERGHRVAHDLAAIQVDDRPFGGVVLS